jgi:dihydropteroate synthase
MMSSLNFSKPNVMGILNVTPDSFSDGGHFVSLDAALFQVERMVDEGADIIDVGGESTRPGAAKVSLQAELDRVIPVIQAIGQRFDTPISVDSSKARVMDEALKAGAVIVNDVNALQAEGAIDVVRESSAYVCLMHMQGQPDGMQANPHYEEVVSDVSGFLQQRAKLCIQSGIEKQKIWLDPGFGFGKTVAHNFALLAKLDKICQLGFTVLVGLSRKSMLGMLLDREVKQRLAGSIASALIAVQKGAQIVRVHDVKETVDALKVLSEVTH